MIVIVCVALTADWLIGTLLHNLPVVELPFTYGVLLGPLVIVWYVVGELGSLAEHAIAMGAPYPAWLPKILEAGKNAVDKVGEELTGPPTEPSEAGPVGRGGTAKRLSFPRRGKRRSVACADEGDDGKVSDLGLFCHSETLRIKWGPRRSPAKGLPWGEEAQGAPRYFTFSI